MFASQGPQATLRAVGGLFPEAVHVLVRRDSPITDVSQLRGKRVAIGTPSSGTRFDAIGVLEAYGLQPGDLAEANEDPPGAALDRWIRGDIEAVFLTSAAPATLLQQVAVKPGFRLLPISGPNLERLVQARPGLAPLTLPAHTYPQQPEGVATAASAALLVTTEDAPDAEVEHLAEFLFGRRPGQGGGGDVVKVSADNELRGVTIPLHPGAGRHTR
jgi:TRAP transporter TAXI family solute receptor